MTQIIATVAVCLGAYFLWKISEQMPDVIFRLSEIQRDLAELRRGQEQD